uniref:Uncharacterized protein n=1 Tax=Kalanchoe fedtschenkoi TaxID=63787 RepID=A0A7N0ZXP2_KALFE
MALHFPGVLPAPRSHPRSFATGATSSAVWNGNKFLSLRNSGFRHVEPRGLFVANVGASAGMPDDDKKIAFTHLKEKVREIWGRFPQPVKIFPWNRAADHFIQLILDLVLAVVKYLSVPLLAVTSLSELSYCAHERKLFLTPVPLLIGVFLAGVLKETLFDLSPLLREAEVPWHLFAIAVIFTLLKLPGPYYPYWGRIFILNMANGALLRTLWFAFECYYRKPRKTSGIVHCSISTDIQNSRGAVGAREPLLVDDRDHHAAAKLDGAAPGSYCMWTARFHDLHMPGLDHARFRFRQQPPVEDREYLPRPIAPV